MSDAAKAPPSPIIPQLIVGLGNPGAKYENTRHNIGFTVLDELARSWQISLAEQKKFQGWFGEGTIACRKVRLLKPSTYMNNSGQAIRAVVDWYKLDPEAVLVVYDDMDLPVGKLRMRLSGSAGGQNGMKSAIAHLGTQKFPRLRVGIGSKSQDAVSHVLGSFAPGEKVIMQEVVRLSSDAIAASLREGVEKAMNLYNNRVIEASVA
ncbi:aminoacyl-tRNA hydrolase [Alkalinema sp. FACHB-956]|uniref:aminoacyl-tRNA hydrolase n=1 Tax=Alkalinema sp. FACHB-956 TaxID=2692768 RepID=UPI001688E021|nr:aminoacyl-tRNA hydrolase [Alkalinema sp. FACHB-956]MBD2327498.1 aminoacyl-tRNA hydrolase [Alkalinema sp. FACHB-956]